MERLYNPDMMSEAEIKQTFVARQGLLDELVTLLERQPEGAGVQHAVIVAPRGMGKTTILLMVQFAVTDRGLASQWQVVRFPEESYAVNDLGDFWIETLQNLAVAVDDATLGQQAVELPEKYRRNADLQEAALAVLKDWSRRENKRLLLLVDNFDQILEQIGSERDNAALRNILMNDGTIMLVGAAPAFFHEAKAYDQPLYNFFRIFHLEELKFEEILDLLRQRAAADGTPGFEAILKANNTRLRVLRYFTGGNPRLVLMLYRVVSQSQVGEVRQGLEKLLDEVTPYYKAKIDSLPAQQRKILDHIARISSQTNEGLTPGEIARATRLSPQAASSQLKRLAELGYVRAANLRGRHSFYTLSEPLYAIWHQMRFGRGPQRRVQWLVDFLKGLYDAEELGSESQRLEKQFYNLLKEGLKSEALSALEYRGYLAHAMSDELGKLQTLESVVGGYLQLKELTSVREMLSEIPLGNFSEATLQSLLETGCIQQEAFDKALLKSKETKAENKFSEIKAMLRLGVDAWESGDPAKALIVAEQIISSTIEQQMVERATWLKGLALFNLKRQRESIEALQRAVEFMPDNAEVMASLGHVLNQEKKFEEALELSDRAHLLEPDNKGILFSRGSALAGLNRHKEALTDFQILCKLSPQSFEAWSKQAESLFSLGKYKDATIAFKRALRIKPDDILTSMSLAFALLGSNDASQGLITVDRILPIYRSKGFPEEGQQMLLSLKLLMLVSSKKLMEARPVFEELSSFGHTPSRAFSLIEQMLLFSAQRSPQFIHELITETKTQEIFFPLSRALDYIFSGDEALIEKLSPEVRNLVQELVEKLRPAAEQTEPIVAPRPRKTKSVSRSRTRKQLR